MQIVKVSFVNHSNFLLLMKQSKRMLPLLISQLMSCHPVTIGLYKLLNALWRLMNNNNSLRIFLAYPSEKRLNVKFRMPFICFCTIKYCSPFIESAFTLNVNTEVTEQDIKKELLPLILGRLSIK